MPPLYYSTLPFFSRDILITLLSVPCHMANQYSITVSNGADAVLKDLKKRGMKMSQCIDAAIMTLGADALVRLVTTQKLITEMLKDEEGDE